MSASPPSSQRLASLDALRGFDMFWILGLSAGLESILKAFFPESSLTKTLSLQLSHVAWEGFHFYDLIFPLFVFLAGVSSAIALPRRLEKNGVASTVQHLLVRALILFALGVFFNGGLAQGLEKVRWMGVLQRIGIASACAGLLSLRLSSRALVVGTMGLLVGYAIPFFWVPVPGTGATGFAQGNNIANYVDHLLLPGRLHNKTWDPEGLLSTLPAIASAILGVLAGRWMMQTASQTRILRGLLGAGVTLLALGWTFHPVFPVIKRLWSPTFVLVSAGWSALLLGAFYWIMDVRGFHRWATPFLWIGANPIALYLLNGLGLFRGVAGRLVPESVAGASWLLPLASAAVLLLFARWLHQQKIFIRV
jgi:predicted acyltransferase